MKKKLMIVVLTLIAVLLAGCFPVQQTEQIEKKQATAPAATAEEVTDESQDTAAITEPKTENTTKKTTKTTAVTQISKTQKTTKGRIGREEAKAIALKRYGLQEKSISRYEIELDYDDDARRWEYEIGFYVGSTEYDLEIDATTGKVLRAEKEVERKPITTSTTKKKAVISKAQAKVAALKRAGVTEKEISQYEIELDYDDDARRWEYEISFRVGRVEYDITIHGGTGKVLEYEKDVD